MLLSVISYAKSIELLAHIVIDYSSKTFKKQVEYLINTNSVINSFISKIAISWL